MVAFLRSRTGLTLAVFLAIGAFFLATEHTAHVFGALPFLLLLACPLMHLFMHGGHGGHGGNSEGHAGQNSAGHAGNATDASQPTQGGQR